MRAPFALLLLAAAPLAAQQPTSPPSFLTPQAPITTDDALAFYEAQSYVPIRRGEVYTAGFLTEGKELTFGRVIGPTRPPQVAAHSPAATMTRGAVIGVEAPAGASWNVGDTLVFAVRRPALKGWGHIVVPTGIARVSAITPRQVNVVLLTVYGPVRPQQLVYRLPALPTPGEATLAKVTNGVRGEVIGPRDQRELVQPGGHLFIDLGSVDGVRLGDFIEIRRAVAARRNGADTIDELMGVGQVVNVNDQSSTIRLVSVTTPDIAAGTPAIRVATLSQ
jgi:hypothetical protein